MPKVSIIKKEIRAAQKIRLPWWAVLLLIGAFFCVSLIFDYFGKFDIALPAMNAAGVLAFVLVLKRSSFRHIWFWVVMVFFTILHVLLVWFVPWPKNWIPALVFGGIGSLDLIAMLTIITLVGKLIDSSKSARD